MMTTLNYGIIFYYNPFFAIYGPKLLLKAASSLSDNF